jgi:hypothetical protein
VSDEGDVVERKSALLFLSVWNIAHNEFYKKKSKEKLSAIAFALTFFHR